MSRRAVIAVVIAALVVLGAGVVGVRAYADGGARLRPTALAQANAVGPGVLLYNGITLGTTGGTVTIDSVSLRSVTPGLHVVTLFHHVGVGDRHLGSTAGDTSVPLTDPKGKEVHGTDADLVLVLSADQPGAYRVQGVDVRYGGWLRHRTVSMPVSMCLVVRPAGSPPLTSRPECPT